MGLDIYVYKPIDMTGEDAQILQNSYFDENIKTKYPKARLYRLDENPELVKFEKFAHFVDIEEYDIKQIYSTYGINDGDIVGYSADFENLQTPEEKYFVLWELKDGRTLRIEEKTLPRITRNVKVIPFEEIGYQRKGANAAFYDENMWGGPFVVDIETLTDHWNKYFSGDVKTEKEKLNPDEFTGFGVEYDLGADENRNRFKENILDRFIDGETVVAYL